MTMVMALRSVLVGPETGPKAMLKSMVWQIDTLAPLSPKTPNHALLRVNAEKRRKNGRVGILINLRS